MVLYRPHRHLLDDAMSEVIEVSDRADLIRHLVKELRPWFIEIDDSDIRIEPYCYDDRINWDTYIVTLRNKQQNAKGSVWFFGEDMGADYFGAIGFTNGPL
jgi:hypothetical protein